MQPHVSWKGTSRTAAVPGYSRPDLNATGSEFRPNPIKHYRRQLMPNANSGRSNASAVMYMDIPGGLGSIDIDCSDPSVHLINVPFPTDKLDIHLCCKDIRKESRKSASTVLKKSYHTDSVSYLRSRGKTYNQNITGSYNTANASNEYDVNTLIDHNGCQKKTYIYKPNNKQFATQGAVSSSSRLERLKLNTIQLNNSTIRSAWAAQGANGGKYHGTMTSTYFIKSRNNVCNEHTRRGNKLTCSTIPAPVTTTTTASGGSGSSSGSGSGSGGNTTSKK